MDNLSQWKYEGVIYRKIQDPGNPDGKLALFAPDVGKGRDGRYYLYYGLKDAQYIAVAVSESPSGPFEYYGRVSYPDGKGLEGVAFDPAILVEDNHVYLYYGFSTRIKNDIPTHLYGRSDAMPGAYVVILDDDMKTVVSDPYLVANGQISSKGTAYEEHPFLEASSIRKIGEKYYFVYSSIHGHELCYGTADTPLGPFEYKGVIISNGDIGISEKPTAYMANNHGGIEKVNGQYYIFYHRHTHNTHYCRQGCAEKISIQEDGSIPQVEMTSCGLSFNPLPAKKEYPAYIICNLHGSNGAGMIPSKVQIDKTVPFLAGMEENENQNMCLYNLHENAVCGVKYLDFQNVSMVEVAIRGSEGKIFVHIDSELNEPSAEILIYPEFVAEDTDQKWNLYTAHCRIENGVHAVYFRFKPKYGAMDFLKFRFS